MQKFYANSMREAMESIHRALGDNAIILDVKADRDTDEGGVEVWASLPAVSPPTNTDTENGANTTPADTPLAIEDVQLHALQAQLASVHRQLATLTDGLHWLGLGSLGSSGVLLQCLADGLAQQLNFSGGIQMVETPHRVALIGPTGVGKSTTIAKLAWQYAIERQIAVGVITTDTIRVGAIEQMRTYCHHLGVPLEVVYRAEDVPQALAQLASCDLLLIDTPGGSQRNTAHLDELAQFLLAFDPTELHLVLNAGHSTAVAREVLARYGALQPDQILFTKLDEAVGVLELFTLLIGSGLAMSYLSAGPSIETNLEIATAEAVSRILARE